MLDEVNELALLEHVGERAGSTPTSCAHSSTFGGHLGVMVSGMVH